MFDELFVECVICLCVVAGILLIYMVFVLCLGRLFIDKPIVFHSVVILSLIFLFDVFRQQRAYFMHLAFWNVVFVCLQNYVDEYCVCNMWVSGYFCICKNNSVSCVTFIQFAFL